MNRRTFTAAELARFFKSQANEANGYAVDLGEGFKAVQMAKGDGLLFTIEKSGELIGRGRKFSDEIGNPRLLSEMTWPELEEISGILWDKYAPFFADDPAPDKPARNWVEDDARFQCRDTEKGRLCLRKDIDPVVTDDLESLLMPDELRDKMDDPNLEPDPTGLLPDYMRKTRTETALEKRIANGTATPEERVEHYLTPDHLK